MKKVNYFWSKYKTFIIPESGKIFVPLWADKSIPWSQNMSIKKNSKEVRDETFSGNRGVGNSYGKKHRWDSLLQIPDTRNRSIEFG